MFIILTLIQLKISNMLLKIITKKKLKEDERGRILDESINAIKLVKFHGLEPKIKHTLKKIRQKETTQNAVLLSLTQLSYLPSVLAPMILSLITFLIFSNLCGELKVEQIYAILGLYYCLCSKIKSLVYTITLHIESLVISDRFWKLSHIDKNDTAFNKEDNKIQTGEVKISEGEFLISSQKKSGGEEAIGDESDLDSCLDSLIQESKNQELNDAKCLREINVSIKKGEFIGVFGEVGSGKSSFFKGIMKELGMTKGKLQVNGSIGYIPQEPFIMNETILNNIVFGKNYNKRKFREIVEICELTHDINSLIHNEYTVIEENGANLSGGQKQRISIARALYSDADIYLIDDALSALDVKVKFKIFNNVFKKFLKGKTRIFIFQEMEFSQKFDRVFEIKNWKIKEKKLEEEKLNKLGDGFGRYDKQPKEIKYRPIKNFIDDKKLGIVNLKKEEREEDLLSTGRISNRNSMINDFKILQNKKNEHEPLLLDEPVSNNREDEGRNTGSAISFFVQKTGKFNFSLIIGLYLATSLLKLYSDAWLGYWPDDQLQLGNKNYYPFSYSLIFIVSLILSITRSVLLGVVFSKSGERIFEKIMENLLKMKMRFFEDSQNGDFLNLLTADIADFEREIPSLIIFIFLAFFDLVGTCLLCLLLSPPVVVVIVVLALMLKSPIKKFTVVVIKLEKMLKISTSFLISKSLEVTKGRSSIRIFGKRKHFSRILGKRLDVSISAFTHLNYSRAYMKVKTDYSTIFIISFALVSIVTINALG